MIVVKKLILTAQWMKNFAYGSINSTITEFSTQHINGHFIASNEMIIEQVLCDHGTFICVITDCKRNFEKRASIGEEIENQITQFKSARIPHCAVIFNLCGLMDFLGVLFYGQIYQSMVF